MNKEIQEIANIIGDKQAEKVFSLMKKLGYRKSKPKSLSFFRARFGK